jgi:hypothetical protein
MLLHLQINMKETMQQREENREDGEIMRKK